MVVLVFVYIMYKRLHHIVEELNLFGVLSEGNHSLLPRGGVAHIGALAALLTSYIQGVYFLHLGAGEQFLNSLLDLNLAGVLGNLEGIFLHQDDGHGLFRNDRLNDNVLCSFHYAYTSSIFLAASFRTTKLSQLRMSYTQRVLTVTTLTPAMFRALL